MLDRIRAMFAGDDGDSALADGNHTADALQIAAAVLLVSAARMDDSVGQTELERIEELLVERFALTPAEAESLAELAEREAHEASDYWRYARVVKDGFSSGERVEMIEMLWEVAYADGEVHHQEANLVRRVAGLIYVPDRDSGAARKRVEARINTSQV